jgi:hypothetical protein
LPGHRYGKLFIGKPCKKRVDDLLQLNRHILKTAVAIFTGHAHVRKHLVIMGLFDGDPTAGSAGKKVKQCTILSAGARRWLFSATMFLGIYLSNQKI